MRQRATTTTFPCSLSRAFAAAAFAALAGFSDAGDSVAAGEICGDATGDGEIRSADALITLRGAVGVTVCPPPRCDANSSGSVTASDAMSILQSAVGMSVVLQCPAETTSTTTTTSSTSTTLVPDSCGDEVVDDGEDCDPPGGFCRGGCNLVTGICVDFMCSASCECAQPLCGDALLDPGEDCDPPGSACENGTCNAGCGCDP